MKKLIVDKFTRGYGDLVDTLEKNLPDGFGDVDMFAFCEDKCCDNWVNNPKMAFYRGDMTSGHIVLGSRHIGLGTFLSNFANLTENKLGEDFGPNEGQWTTFDLYQKILAANHEAHCKQLSKTDKFLHDYFKDLANAIGFEKNHSISLFDLPSMMRTSFDSKVLIQNEMTKDVFLYSQCKMGTTSGTSFHKCYQDAECVIFTKKSLNEISNN